MIGAKHRSYILILILILIN